MPCTRERRDSHLPYSLGPYFQQLMGIKLHTIKSCRKVQKTRNMYIKMPKPDQANPLTGRRVFSVFTLYLDWRGQCLDRPTGCCPSEQHWGSTNP